MQYQQALSSESPVIQADIPGTPSCSFWSDLSCLWLLVCVPDLSSQTVCRSTLWAARAVLALSEAKPAWICRKCKAVVVAIRGTMSLADLVTDAVVEPHHLKDWMPAATRKVPCKSLPSSSQSYRVQQTKLIIALHRTCMPVQSLSGSKALTVPLLALSFLKNPTNGCPEHRSENGMRLSLGTQTRSISS